MSGIQPIQDQQLVCNVLILLIIVIQLSLIFIIGHEEFQVVSNTIYFYTGDTVGDVRCASVTIVDDTKIEEDEFFYFRISSGWRTQVSEYITTINILENDGI